MCSTILHEIVSVVTGILIFKLFEEKQAYFLYILVN